MKRFRPAVSGAVLPAVPVLVASTSAVSAANTTPAGTTTALVTKEDALDRNAHSDAFLIGVGILVAVLTVVALVGFTMWQARRGAAGRGKSRRDDR